jgi:thioredoxin reductase
LLVTTKKEKFMSNEQLPVAVIGAGPVGLAAAAHLLARGLKPIILEAGPSVGASILKWGHVRMFSPWHYSIDAEARRILEAEGWEAPDSDAYPTGQELVDHYLQPLAQTQVLKAVIRYSSRVTAVTKRGRDVMKNHEREEAPFLLRVETAHGAEYDLLARAVIDASGTFEQPNPMGAHGLTVPGEKLAAAHIAYGIPDVKGKDRARYANQRILVIGSGHSALNVLQDLVRLKETAANTEVHWAMRKNSADQALGGGKNDKLVERGRLGSHIRSLIEAGSLHLHTAVSIDELVSSEEGLIAKCEQGSLPPVDEIIVTTGFRPDLSMLREVRLSLDAATQSPTRLAPLIDPNHHSCGTVRPHGAEELKHPEENFYIVGMKSYGRAPTFLLLTGYEQVRSVVSALSGDWEAARRVHLVLPETGVCSAKPRPNKVCCG